MICLFIYSGFPELAFWPTQYLPSPVLRSLLRLFLIFCCYSQGCNDCTGIISSIFGGIILRDGMAKSKGVVLWKCSRKISDEEKRKKPTKWTFDELNQGSIAEAMMLCDIRGWFMKGHAVPTLFAGMLAFGALKHRVRLPSCKKAQGTWRGHMLAHESTVPGIPSLWVIPAKMPLMRVKKKPPDIESPPAEALDFMEQK